jgi:ABC-2 type transport system ATP-binding protein
MSPVVSTEHLTKRYGRRLAVDDVSLTVERGEVMGLLGPNGSGKTTFLRVLAGYLHPTSGTARIADLDVVEESLRARQRVGYVPEDTPLYPGMDVAEFLTFMGRLKGLAGRDVAVGVDAAVERLGLQTFRRVQIGRLSHGYRQRVAVAQALLGDPDLLILDEPTNGLDPRQIIEVRQLIRSLAGERTILVTSHILAEIERVADRVAILLDGRLLAVHPLRIADGRARLRLRVRGDVEKVRACALAVPGVISAEVEQAARTGPDAVYLVVLDSPSTAESVAGAIVSQGYGLRSLEPAAGDLETFFLRLTAGPASGCP